jgi:prepilin-type N-terminal cleavage/methylation domain-containing protein
MRNERGVALLEVLVALAILATAGVSLVELVGAGLRSERDARRRETTLATEERLLAALTLLKRPELDQRIGRRDIGEFIVDVQRPEPTLYRIALLQQQSPTMEDLVTVVYRPDSRP